MDNIQELLKIIIIRLDRIYSHLEVDWDNLSKEELSNRYESMNLLLRDIKENNKSLYVDIKSKKIR